MRERVPRPAGLRPARRARPGSTRSRWAGCWGWTGPRRSRRSAARSGCSPRPARPATGSPRWPRRHVAGPPRAGGGALRRRACARLPGHPHDRENPCAPVEVPRPGHGGNLGVRCRRGSAAGGDGRTGRLAGRRAAPADPRAARHRRRRPPGAGRVRPRRLVPDAVRRPGRGRVRHPDLAQGRHRRHRRAPVHRAQPHRRARPHPHLAPRRHRDHPRHRRRAPPGRGVRDATDQPVQHRRNPPDAHPDHPPRPARRRDPLPDGLTLAPGEPLPLRPYPFRPRLPRHLPRRRRRPDPDGAQPGQETRLPRRRKGQARTASSRNRQRRRAAGRPLAATRAPPWSPTR